MSYEAEQSVLGGIMMDNSMLDRLDLNVENFESLDHKIIFKAIRELQLEELPFDAVTLTEHLEKNNKLDVVGGMPYLIDLANNTPSSKNVPAYAKIIMRDFKSNQLKNIGREITMIANEHGDFEPKLEKALSQFDGFNIEGEKDLKSIKTHISEYVIELERRSELDGIDGLETGFQWIDNRLRGLKAGELYIIAGRPASGKSTYALNIAAHVAKTVKTMFFSMEMPSKQLIEKCVSAKSNTPLNWFKDGGKSDSEPWALVGQAMNQINELDLIIDDNGYQTVQSIKIKCKKQGKVGAVFVDYLQLMNGKGNNRTEEIGEISRGLKQLAKELECPVIALSQLNRSVESRKDKRPMMSDLRESGSLEQDSDVIQMIYRDEYYYPECETNKCVAEIATLKFRHGEIGRDFLETNLACSQFKDMGAINYIPYQETESKGGYKG